MIERGDRDAGHGWSPLDPDDELPPMKPYRSPEPDPPGSWLTILWALSALFVLFWLLWTHTS